MGVEVLVETLGVVGVSGEGVESVEGAGGGVVVAGSEVLLADAAVKLLAAVQVLSSRRGPFNPNAIGVGAAAQSGDVRDRSGQIRQDSRRTVAVVVEDQRFALCPPCRYSQPLQ